MSRMLLCVPRMYTEKEFKRLATVLPEDFESKTSEFWSYVEEKLHVFTGKIQRVYRDEVCKGGKEALAYLRSLDRENYKIVKKLIESGASFEAVEDSTLLAESRSWLEMVEREPLNTIALELYQETLKERDRYISSRIDETLKDDELGVLFIEPDREVKLSEPVRIISVCRFDPSDYLRSWQVQLKSK